MKKNYLMHIFCPAKRELQKMLLVMKLTSFLILLFCMQVSAKVYSQDNALTLNMNHVEIVKALRVIEKKSDYRFLYNDALISPKMTVNVHATDAQVPDIVKNILLGTELTYKLIGTHLIVIAARSARIESVHVQGTVMDASGKPLVGVTIQVKGAKVGTVTDVQGNFSLDVPEGAALLVSYVGYDSKEVAVNDQTTLKITLQPSNAGLNEIVVVGYGTQKKSVVTGAITSINASELEDMPVSRIEQSLQGRTSGLTIAASSGQPGSSSTVRVRGTTSINNSDPLYVVDGVVVDVGGIDYLNQSDIQSVEVLKDAASEAIYGARAASGVILITTKKGHEGPMTIHYSGYYGTQAPAKKLHMLNAEQYATLRNEASENDGGGEIFPNPQSLGKGTDWQSLIFNDHASIQNHELSISGGSKRSTYYTSFGFFDQQGIVATPISQYQRFNIRFNSTHNIRSWLHFGENVGYSYIKSKGVGNTNSEFGGPLSSAINLDPTTPVVETDPTVIANSNDYTNPNVVRDKNGDPYGISTQVAQEMANPMAYIQTHLGNYNWSHNIVGNVYLEIQPIKGLNLRSTVGSKLSFWGSQSFTPVYYLNAATSNTTNSFYRDNERGLNFSWENTASYTRSFGLHDLTLLVGTGAYIDNNTQATNVTYYDLPVTNYKDASMNYNLANANRLGSGSEGTLHKVNSLFARLIYNYNKKYLFTGIIRRDGSSRFGSNNKYGYFPSVSAGWVPTLENFWPQNKVVNFLKIRGSYGITGNDNIGDFKYVSTVSGGRNYTFGNDDYEIGYSPDAPANPDLKWEQTSQANIGFDAVIFQDFNLTFDVYKKRTTGMLLQVQLPGYVGATGQPWGNIADMNNKGFEIELGYHKSLGPVDLSISGNASYLQNKVTWLGTDKTYIKGASIQSIQDGEITRTAVGHAIGSFYGFVTDGIFQTQADVDNYVGKGGNKVQPDAKPGDFKWADLNGDGVIDENDRTFIGDPTPNWTYGFTVGAKWNNFDLTVFGQGVTGNKIFQGLRRLDITTANWTTKALGRWNGSGTSNTFPRLTVADPNHNFNNASSFYLESGAYFRIKTLEIGYTLPVAVTGKIGLQKVRVYVSSNNLATITKYSGYDPEIGGSSYGIDRGIYPQARSFMGGLDVSF